MSALVSDFIKEAFPELFVEGQVVAAEQAFERKVFEYEMNLEMQKLFREDLRDLVELTVGRMDSYSLVGALLLEFCISFYCENHMTEAESVDIPPWFLTFFFISNISAAGYLIFAVLLSMHASVASHSVGVRLLTRFARLSVPSHEELEDVANVPLISMRERMEKVRERLGLAREARAPEPSGKSAWQSWRRGRTDAMTTEAGVTGSESSGPIAACSPPVASLAAASPGASSPTTGAPVKVSALVEGSRVQQDHEYHFQRFLKEQRRWLCYDAYARVSMSLGMNQMLIALSYYITGIIALKSLAASVFSLLGVQWLSMLLLRLDVSPGSSHFLETSIAITFVTLPPIYIAMLMHFMRSHGATVAYLATPGYLMHAGWLAFVVCHLWRTHGDHLSVIPKRLRTVLYLDVLNGDQDKTTDAYLDHRSRKCVAELKKLREELQREMQRTVMEETTKNCVSSARRQTAELNRICSETESMLKEARRHGGSSAEVECRMARHTIDQFAVWQQAPYINAILIALKDPTVRKRLNDEECEAVDAAYVNFLSHCHELGLGISVLPSEGVPAASTSESVIEHLSSLAVAPDEGPLVRITCGLQENGHDPVSVWVNTSTEEVLMAEPATERLTTSFATAIETAFPAWTASAERLAHRRQIGENTIEFGSIPEQRDGSGEPPLMPAQATVPEQLPGIIIRLFTLGICLMWIAAAAWHIVDGNGWDHVKPTEAAMLDSQILGVAWPQPAGLFEVTYLHCNQSLVVVGSRFNLYHAARHADTASLGTFIDAGDFQQGTILCAMSGCDSLSPDVSQSSWRLAPLAPPLGSDLTESTFPLPSTWRRVAAVWVRCQEFPCVAARLAAWNGIEVVVADAQQNDAGVWNVRSRFVVRPGLGPCLGKAPGCPLELSAANATSYTEVHAIQLSETGKTLLVLHGTDFMDGWDLVDGGFLGRWRLGGRPTAMCHDGSHLLIAGQGVRGPRLDHAALPRELLDESCRGMPISQQSASV